MHERPSLRELLAISEITAGAYREELRILRENGRAPTLEDIRGYQRIAREWKEQSERIRAPQPTRPSGGCCTK